MKILFIYSIESVLSFKKPLGSPLYIQFGISYLSAFLKQSNHDTELLVLSSSFNKQNYELIKNKIEKFKPNVLGFYSVTTQFKFIASMAKFIKSNYPEIFLVIGGPHAMLNPESVIGGSFDAVCIGEGEIPLLELANMLEKNKYPSNIKNLWIKKDGMVEKNQLSPFFENLDLLAYPDRTIWEEYTDYIPNFLNKNISVLLGRGCPYSCTYCCNHAFRKITDGNYVRYRSPQNIVEEIIFIHEKFPLEKNIYLEVECFNSNTEWAVSVCNEIEKYNNSLDIPLSFGLNIRITPNTNLDVLFEACKRANILLFNIGLESGSERVRKDILNRNYSNSDVITTINSVKKYGLKYNFFVMMGIPGESIEDFKETIKICRICMPEEIFLSVFYPYPGTDLYTFCEKNNLLKDNMDIRVERRYSSLNLIELNKIQTQRNYLWFDYNVYKGHKPRLKLILKAILNFLRLNYYMDLTLTRIFRKYYRQLNIIFKPYQ